MPTPAGVAEVRRRALKRCIFRTRLENGDAGFTNSADRDVFDPLAGSERPCALRTGGVGLTASTAR